MMWCLVKHTDNFTFTYREYMGVGCTEVALVDKARQARNFITCATISFSSRTLHKLST
jgi:hypothetical protein